MPKLNIVICGSGGPAHVLAGLAASRENMEARVLALADDEADRWSASIKKEEMTLSINEGEDEPRVVKSKPRVVTKDPERAVKGANLVILAVSLAEQSQYLEAVVPHLEADSTIIGFPGYAGFEFMCCSYLKSKNKKKCAVVNIETMPYASRVKEFGKNATVLGITEVTRGTMVTGKSKTPYDPMEVLGTILGKFPILERYANYLEPLLATSTIVNPAIMYGKWKNWDGNPLDEKPLFYQGISEQDAKCLEALSEECMEIAKAITTKKKVELDWVIPLYELYLEEFHANAENPENLLSLMKSNSAYDGIYHPMTSTEDGKFMPDFNCRYLNDDVPRGIAITKGIALLVNVKTPIHNSVLEWCQEKMGKEYLKGRDLTGKDIGETGCPQRFGFDSLDDIINIL